MFDHPLLRLSVGGRHAYLEPDLVAFQLRRHVPRRRDQELPVIDGQADPAKVAAAAIQSAVYVLALRDLFGEDSGRVHHETILVCPENFSNRPIVTSIDVRKQLTVLKRQLSRIDRIEDLLREYPDDLTFDLDPDDNQASRRPPAELLCAIKQVNANYAPECLSTCELCYLCRDEAHGTTGALGKSVREDLGGIEYTEQVLALAAGLEPAPDRAEVAALLVKAAGSASRSSRRLPMTLLTSLARALAAETGRAQPIRTVRHVHLSDRPLVFVPLQLAGEACAPLAAMVGDDP